jgi:hypothetical protein
MLLATSAITCIRLRCSPVISPAGLAAGDECGETSYNVNSFTIKIDFNVPITTLTNQVHCILSQLPKFKKKTAPAMPAIII